MDGHDECREPIETEYCHSKSKVVSDMDELEGILADVDKGISAILDVNEHFNKSHRDLNGVRDRLDEAEDIARRAKSAIERLELVARGRARSDIAVLRRELDELIELCVVNRGGVRWAQNHINRCIKRRALASVEGAHAVDAGVDDTTPFSDKIGGGVLLVKDWVNFVDLEV